MEKKIKEIFLIIFFCIALLAITELLLRASTDHPSGYLEYTLLMQDGIGLYPANIRYNITWGPIPHVKWSNSLGIQGDEVSYEKKQDTTRILAIGDSVTDGFFVDTNETYPYMLEGILSETSKNPEVINLARGGGSIDREYMILKSFGIDLNPDIVLLTFVTNDISEIKGVSRTDLINRKPIKLDDGIVWSTIECFFTTAIGEILFDSFMRLTFTTYRAHERDPEIALNKGRYNDPRSLNYSGNIYRFNNAFSKHDGIILNEPFSKEAESLLSNYLFALEHMNDYCLENGVKLVFIYYPSYPQVYNDNASFAIRDILAKNCKAYSIPFLDLTDVLKTNRYEKILHNTPHDFHLNPTGNQIMAEEIARFLSVNKILD